MEDNDMRLTDDMLTNLQEYTASQNLQMSPMDLFASWVQHEMIDIHDFRTAMYVINLIPLIQKGCKRLNWATRRV